MVPRIEFLKEKKLVGLNIKMSLADNKTAQLWRAFGPRIKEINNKVSNDKISMQIYDSGYHQSFSPHKIFEKWATVEVKNFDDLPYGIKTFKLEEGLYAVFDYKGLSSDPSVFEFIFFDWLPFSSYLLDERPHFEVLGEKYKNNDRDSEEEIWIPVVEKNIKPTQ